MKMSTKGQYALEIVVDLALHSGQGRFESLKNIASRRGLSEKYLERIVRALKQQGIVESVRGAYGGYCLKKQPDELSVREVLTAVEGELTPVYCLTRESDCGISCELCPTRDTWGDMWQIITDTVGKITIEDILARERITKGKEVRE